MPWSIAAKLHDFQKEISAINPVFPTKINRMASQMTRRARNMGITEIHCNKKRVLLEWRKMSIELSDIFGAFFRGSRC